MTIFKQNGYALIELLIVLSIIVLFSGLSLAYFRGYDENRKLDAASKQLVDVLNLAQKKANSGDLGPNPNCSDFQGYTVNIDKINSAYSLEFNCSGAPNIIIQSYTLTTGMAILSSPTSSVSFKPLSGGTDLVGFLTITLTNSAVNKCKNVQVNTVGTVEELATCP